jgi:hypothetical protein
MAEPQRLISAILDNGNIAVNLILKTIRYSDQIYAIFAGRESNFLG